jgi:predicted SnoaL-like aldol condensation-catalyzing enzyme
MTTLENNKAIVRRFNKEFIEQGLVETFYELVSPDFVHHTMPEGMAKGPKGLLRLFSEYLRPGFPELKVRIYDQVAEGDKVVTYKAFFARQRGSLLGGEPPVDWIKTEAVEISRLRDGRIVEQWNVMDLQAVLTRVREQANKIY